jgi:hypothetical protein
MKVMRDMTLTHPDGREHTLRYWAKELGVSEETLIIRLRKGHDMETVLQKRYGKGGRQRGSTNAYYERPIRPTEDVFTQYRHGAWI